MDDMTVRQASRAYNEKNDALALFSLGANFLVYFGSLYLAIRAAQLEIWWLYAPLVVVLALAAGRLYVLEHDFGHLSFFSKKKWNVLGGHAVSPFTLAEFYTMQYNHDEHHRQKFLTKLRKENPPRETILAMFEAARVWPLTEGHPPGCFLINAAFEFADRDEEICEMVYESSVRIELFFKKLIVESQGEGTIPLHIDAGETARGLLSLLIGLRVLSHSKPQSPMLKSILKQAESMIS